MSDPSRTAALARTWCGVLLISFSAVFVRLADVEAARSAFLRNLYALPVLLGLMWWQRQRGRAGGVVPLAVVAGVFLGLDLVTWHVSIGIIGAGLGTVIPNLQVVFVGVIALIAFGERPHRAFWMALPVVFVGVWLLATAGRPVTADGAVAVGVAFGIATALFYSGYLLVLRVSRMRRPEASSVAVVASATLGAALATGAVAVVQGVAGPAGSLAADGWLVALALGSQVAGWLLLASSIHLLPAALTSVALLLQPVLTLLWGRVLLGEPIGPAQLAGAAVLLGGVAVAHHAAVLGERHREEMVADQTLL
jgi:drug/metabolite transporter (DMT)-like permease